MEWFVALNYESSHFQIGYSLIIGSFLQYSSTKQTASFVFFPLRRMCFEDVYTPFVGETRPKRRRKHRQWCRTYLLQVEGSFPSRQRPHPIHCFPPFSHSLRLNRGRHHSQGLGFSGVLGSRSGVSFVPVIVAQLLLINPHSRTSAYIIRYPLSHPLFDYKVLGSVIIVYTSTVRLVFD